MQGLANVLTRLGEWASGKVRSVHFKRGSQTKDVSGSDVDVVAVASSESGDRVRKHVDGQVGHMNLWSENDNVNSRYNGFNPTSNNHGRTHTLNS